MQFLTPGQRIKRYRKMLKLTQSDFECDDMTRSYFGMIEVGKRNLNLDIAEVIMRKLNEKARKLNIELDIDAYHLTMSPQDEAREYCINKLYDNPKEYEIFEIINICKEWDLAEVEIEALRTLGDIYYVDNRFLDSFIKYSDALDLCKNIGKTDIQSYLYNRLGGCKYNELDYEESILYFTRAQQYAKIYEDPEVERKAIFNIASVYIRLHKVDETVAYIDLYLCKIDTRKEYINQYIHAHILKANCLEMSGKIEDAIDILKKLSDENYNISETLKGNIYNNLGVLYFKKDDFDNSLKAFNESELIRLKYDEKNLSHTIVDKAFLYMKMKLYTEAIILVNIGIDLTKKFNDSYYLLKAYYLLIEIYEKRDMLEDVEKTYLEIISLVERKENYKEQVKAYLKIGEFYANHNEIEKVIKFLQISQKVIEKCGN